MTGGYVYLLANRKNGAIYTGVTSDIFQRMDQHRLAKGSAVCAKYGISKFVYLEPHETIAAAIAREKAIEKWRRAWKVDLIYRDNPDWRDLSYELGR